jgi:hypothetical protein
MNREDPKHSADDPASPEPADGTSRSGEGAATALKAMLRKRQQAERPENPPNDTPPCPQA